MARIRLALLRTVSDEALDLVVDDLVFVFVLVVEQAGVFELLQGQGQLLRVQRLARTAEASGVLLVLGGGEARGQAADETQQLLVGDSRLQLFDMLAQRKHRPLDLFVDEALSVVRHEEDWITPGGLSQARA